MIRLSGVVQRLTLLKPNEFKVAAASFVMVFLLMAAYFVLRPVRDAMASDWTDTEVSMLWNLQFFISAVLVAAYGLTISHIKFKWVVPLVYSGFAGSFILFYWLTPKVADPTLLEKSFYVWVTAFSLFHLSVFWSFMTDTFTQEQGRRLFAVIGAGASMGALVGPAIPVLYTSSLGLDQLMLIAAAGLFLVVPLIFYIGYLKRVELGNEHIHTNPEQARLGGRWWAGFRDVIHNRFLLAIAGFIFLYVFVGSFVYFEQKNLLAEYSRADRARILGSIDWLVNVLTFVFAFLLTGRLVQRLGMAATLALVPIALVVGMTVLAFAPVVIVLLATQVARRVGNYSVTRPAREMLFTKVTKEQRFKAKPVLDVVVYRGGDALSGSIFAALSDGLGLALATLSLLGAAVASLWASLGIYLGRRYRTIDSQRSASNVSQPALFEQSTV